MSWNSPPCAELFQNPLRGLGERSDGAVRGAAVGSGFRVAVVDQDGRTARRPRGRDIFPSIADQEARPEIDAVLGGSAKQETRTRLPAIALVAVVVVADEQVIQPQRLEQRGVHRLHHLPPLGPASDVRLVGDPDEEQARGPERPKRGGGIGEDFEVSQRGRRIGLPVPHNRPVQHSVSVEEGGAARGGAHRTDSHLVGAALSLGSETKRCQMTAWKASVWGVTWAGLTVGTITQASATVAVKPPSRPTTPATRAPTALA